jgi:hypothetical protein
MRKRLIASIGAVSKVDRPWLDVDRAAVVEMTSEEAAHPVEAALVPGDERGWRAAGPGPQTIRLLFDNPQKLQRIWLDFEESEIERTQEFVLRWSVDAGQSYREIVRQQWNFSPPGTVREIEDYAVELSGVTVLELNIVPSRSGSEARASLSALLLS